MTQIPQPRGLPILGNVNEIDPSNWMKSFARLTGIYGPIYRLKLLSRSKVVLNTQELVNEVCDEKRIHKVPNEVLTELRHGLLDGLFTAFEEEENWGLAHRILMPSFGPMAMANMFSEMHEVACQMVARWACDPMRAIDPTEDFTKLTLDPIALCAMDTRFNSFCRENLHPFVGAMVYFLEESGRSSLRPQVMSDYYYRSSTRQYNEAIETMKTTALEVIERRRRNPSGKADLLNAMINGHETTSGMLSFLFVLLLQDPAKLRSVQEEVDRVIRIEPITFAHLSKLPYITACLRETLRLWSTVPVIGIEPRSTDDKDFPMFIGKERYQINKGDSFLIYMAALHHDPAVYGEDAHEFRPERMLDSEFNKLPPNSWKPFGNGMRACIGRTFAWQEAHTIVAMLLQNFTFQADITSYVMDTKFMLTVKPAALEFSVTRLSFSSDSHAFKTIQLRCTPLATDKKH